MICFYVMPKEKNYDKLGCCVAFQYRKERTNFMFRWQSVLRNDILTHVKKTKHDLNHYLTVEMCKSKVKYIKIIFLSYNTI